MEEIIGGILGIGVRAAIIVVVGVSEYAGKIIGIGYVTPVLIVQIFGITIRIG